jgi:hypothetical protein
MATEEQLKERALFYIDRKLRTLEGVLVDHEELAKKGASYTERRTVEERSEQELEKMQNEREAMQWARDKLMEVK